MKSIFVVQPSRNKKYGIYRLGLDRPTTEKVKKHQFITLKLAKSLTIYVKVVCGPPNKKTFDVNHHDLNFWIKKNKFHIYPDRHPTKLEFDLDKSTWTFTFKNKIKTSL